MKSSSYGLIALLTALMLSACGQDAPTEASKQADLRARTNLIIPIYTVAMDADYPPYDFRDDKGNAVGFDVDILQAIGERQGFKVNIVPINWSALLNSLEKNTYDIAIGGIAETDIKDEKYHRVYHISKHYFYGNDAIATRTEVKDIKTFQDLKHRKVATLAESGYVDDLTKLQGENSKNLIAKETTFLAYKELFNGHADAVLADKGVLAYYQFSKPQYRINIGGEGDYFSKPYGMVFLATTKQPALIQQINQGIAQIVDDGTYTQIHQKWFGTEPKIMPNPNSSTTEDFAKNLDSTLVK